MNKDEIAAFLSDESNYTNYGELDSESAEDCYDACRSLIQVRRLFTGTPMEKEITRMIEFCDTTSKLIGEILN